jgi:hypothetical protein
MIYGPKVIFKLSDHGVLSSVHSHPHSKTTNKNKFSKEMFP